MERWLAMICWAIFIKDDSGRLSCNPTCIWRLHARKLQRIGIGRDRILRRCLQRIPFSNKRLNRHEFAPKSNVRASGDRPTAHRLPRLADVRVTYSLT